MLRSLTNFGCVLGFIGAGLEMDRSAKRGSDLTRTRIQTPDATYLPFSRRPALIQNTTPVFGHRCCGSARGGHLNVAFATDFDSKSFLFGERAAYSRVGCLLEDKTAAAPGFGREADSSALELPLPAEITNVTTIA